VDDGVNDQSTSARLTARELGLFQQFSAIADRSCALCASKYDPFYRRVFVRLFSLVAWLNIFPSTKLLSILWLIFLLPFAVALEVALTAVASQYTSMRVILSALLIIVCILVPTYLVANTPQAFNPLAQVLFSIVLTGASVWFGISLNDKNARKEAARRWLPAAETACKQLLTISNTAERMRLTQTTACNSIEPLLPKLETSLPIKQMVDVQCRETAEKLATLRDHIDSAVSHWEVFIASNCEKGECDAISFRIGQVRTTLEAKLKEDFKRPDCEQTRNTVALVHTEEPPYVSP
jgi:hypothetical protein